MLMPPSLIWALSWCDAQSRAATSRQRLMTIRFVKFKAGMVSPLSVPSELRCRPFERKRPRNLSAHSDETIREKHFRRAKERFKLIPRRSGFHVKRGARE